MKRDRNVVGGELQPVSPFVGFEDVHVGHEVLLIGVWIDGTDGKIDVTGQFGDVVGEQVFRRGIGEMPLLDEEGEAVVKALVVLEFLVVVIVATKEILLGCDDEGDVYGVVGRGDIKKNASNVVNGAFFKIGGQIAVRLVGFPCFAGAIAGLVHAVAADAGRRISGRQDDAFRKKHE